MQEAESYSTLDVMTCVLKVRPEVSVTAQDHGGRPCYLLEDPVASRFYRIGVAEYSLLSLLDGRRTLTAASSEAASALGGHGLSEQETLEFAKWLVDSQIATTVDALSAARLSGAAERHQQALRKGRRNPLIVRIPLFNPSAILKYIAPLLGLAFTLGGFIACAALLLVGALLAYERPELLSGTAILDRNNWVWLVLTWLGLKLIHESGHAAACRRFGGTVRECGLVFVLLAPMPYVDLTAIWKCDSKWLRVITSLAGVYFELCVAAICMIVLANTSDATVSFHARNVIYVALFASLVVNLNPLMRFDGYYVLCDLFDFPNLATWGNRQVSYLAQRYLLGVELAQPRLTGMSRLVVTLYGIAAFIWRIVVTCVLTFAAAHLFAGAGILVAAVAVVTWTVPGFVFLSRFLYTATNYHRLRLGALGMVCLALTWLSIEYLRFEETRVADVIVAYDSPTEVRAQVRGFLDKVDVGCGDRVLKGQVLASLENRPLRLEVQRLQSEIDQSEIRARGYRLAQLLPALQAEQASLQALREQILERQQQLEALCIKAPVDGEVVVCKLRFREATLVQQGEHLVTIVDPNRKSLRLLVPQHDIKQLPPKGKLRLDGIAVGNKFAAGLDLHLRQHKPEATTEVEFPAITSLGGGPLPVSEAKSTAGDKTWRLVRPHIVVTADIEKSFLWSLRSGQIGTIRWTTESRLLKEVIWEQWHRLNLHL